MASETMQISNDTNDVPVNEEVVAPKVAKLNPDAKEFQPVSIKSTLRLRPSAPEFIPVRSKSSTLEPESIYSEVLQLVQAAGIAGIVVKYIPHLYRLKFEKDFDLSGCSSSDLSVLLQEIPRLLVSEPSRIPRCLRDALVLAGFSDEKPSAPPSCVTTPVNASPVEPEDPSLVMGCRDFFEHRRLYPGSPPVGQVGVDADKVVVDSQQSQFVNELKTFKDSIVDMIARTNGVAIASLASEWEKSFVAKGLVGMPDFQSLIARFHVVDLGAFLSCIPSLEVSASRAVKLRSPLNTSKSVVVLDNELFGGPKPALRAAHPAAMATISNQSNPSSSQSVQMKQHISPPLVHQLLGQVEAQVLELGSHLARRGLESSSQDLVWIRLQLQQLQTLKTSLKGVLQSPTLSGSSNASPVLGPSSSQQQLRPSASQGTYAALLTQAAQYAMSGKPAPTGGVSGLSTAAASRKASPTSAQQELTKEDIVQLVCRVVERASAQGTGGIAASSIKDEWQTMFPSIAPLDFFFVKFGWKSVKEMFTDQRGAFGDKLVLFYATLPSPQLKVATKTEFNRCYGGSRHVIPIDTGAGSVSPLISPSSTCSFTSESAAPTLACRPQDKGRMMTELILKNVRLEYIRQLRSKARSDPQLALLVEVLEIVENCSPGASNQRLLESKRPPPIDTGLVAPSAAALPTAAAVAAVAKQFASVASGLLLAKSVSCAVDVSAIPQLWKSDFGSELPSEEINALLKTTAGVRLLGKEKCTLTALASPGAIVSSLFGIGDSNVWANSNVKLIDAVKRVVRMDQPSAGRPTTLASMIVGPSQSGGSSSSAPIAAKDGSVTHSQLSELSSILFKSIMAGGPKSAKECAKALKVLAANNPKAIHEVVSTHIASLQQVKAEGSAEAAANNFVMALMEKGRQLKKEQQQQSAKSSQGDVIMEKLFTQLRSHQQLPFATSSSSSLVQPADPTRYSRGDLLGIQQRMDAEGALAEPPAELRALKIVKKQVQSQQHQVEKKIDNV